MGTAFIVVWGIALLIIAILLVILMITFQQNARGDERIVQENNTLFVPFADTLLFYYDKQSVRDTENGQVLIHIRGISWDASWQDDLLRVKVVAQDPQSVTLGDIGYDAQVLAAYEFGVYRMTEMGTDIPVSSFVKSVDVFLATNPKNDNLDVLIQREGEWVSAPKSETRIEELVKKDGLEKTGWVAASVLRLDRLCLIKKMPRSAADDE
ncbi:MAG: hypothetical protein JXA89_06705 [Anaerolineae bacterium]|nr:hypothetical protein [Anaerolineae bacterium]